MAKEKTVFACQKCGYQTPRWLGRCPDCGEWNALIEERYQEVPIPRVKTKAVAPRPISEIASEDIPRLETGISELDRILGGGIVPGSAVLIGGAPGIGKSTLLLQMASALSERNEKVLYVSGEESASQTKLRAKRLGVASENLYLVNETNLDLIIDYIEKLSPRVVVIDSIQIVYIESFASSPGSITQVRECGAELVILGKNSGISIFLVGHVTKEGYLAGPRVLEHLVDTVVYFEGETNTSFRILRATKNRFGATNELGIFEMQAGGLREVKNPSEVFLSERPGDSAGSMVVPVLEGSRPLLREVQALVTVGNPGMPRRTTTGLDYNRIAILLAVLEKRAGLRLREKDVFVNVAGGGRIVEPAADLAIAIAIASSLKEKPAPRAMVAAGEVGLAGEVRSVFQIETRLREAEKLGFKKALVAKSDIKNLGAKGRMEIIAAATVAEALKAAL